MARCMSVSASGRSNRVMTRGAGCYAIARFWTLPMPATRRLKCYLILPKCDPAAPPGRGFFLPPCRAPWARFFFACLACLPASPASPACFSFLIFFSRCQCSGSGGRHAMRGAMSKLRYLIPVLWQRQVSRCVVLRRIVRQRPNTQYQFSGSG